MVRLRFFLLIIVGLLVTQVNALAPNGYVGDFRLFDHAGGSHHLHYFSDKKAVVLLVQDLSCAASKGALDQVRSITSGHGEAVEFEGSFLDEEETHG